MSTASSTPRLYGRMCTSGAEILRVTAGGFAEYWTGALSRGAGPWDLWRDAARWWAASAGRERPRWHTSNEVVLETPLARLRDFSGEGGADVVPTLVLPPEAGHDSCIVDYLPRQSQIKAILDAGLTRLFSADWIGATAETRDATVEDHLDFLARCVDAIGAPLNLVGDCQGGWLAAIYAALRPQDVNTLTIAGAPIDFHAGDGVIGDYVRLLAGADLGFYRWVVAQGGGVLRGEFVRNGFIALKPEHEVAKHVGLLARLDDAEHVERHAAFETWFRHTQDIPGAFYLWIVEHLFARNELVRGELRVDGRRISLADVTCPLFLVAGERDHITPPAQVFAAADHVGTPAADIVRRTTAGGHLGLFMGTDALRDHWPPVLRALRTRS